MNRSKNISLLLALVAFMFGPSVTKAQVTATAAVTLTVIAAPGMNFSSAQKERDTSSVVKRGVTPENGVMTFQSSGNEMVQLKSTNSATERFNFKQDQMRTFTARELKKVSTVEIDYLGS